MRKSLRDERWDMLGRRTCRDMRGYAGICGDMRDGPPPRNRPGRAAVFGPAPPIHKGRETGTANDLQAEKRMLIFHLNY